VGNRSGKERGENIMADQAEPTGGIGLEQAAIQEFGATLRGELLRPGEDSYEEARKVFNVMIDTHLYRTLTFTEQALSFRETHLPEARFPRTPLLGNS